jgi:protein-L-isoaspartate O-methyltransferase
MAGSTDAEQLHEALVRTIRATGGARREPVRRAPGAVPRHLFVPEVPAGTVIDKRHTRLVISYG